MDVGCERHQPCHTVVRLTGARLLVLSGLLVACERPRLEHVGVAELERRLRVEVEHGHAPAVFFAMARGDGRSIILAAGDAGLSPPRPATGEMSFPWFSITKLFTATAVLQLVEAGKVRLDAPAASYVPSFRPAGGAPTVRQLLAHTSGLPDPIPVSWIHPAGERGPGLDALTARRLAQNSALKFEPGARFSYSNLNYLVLGQLVERVSGESFEDYVRAHVLAPLRATRTGFRLPDDAVTGFSRRWSVMGVAARFMLDHKFFGPTARGFTALAPFEVDGAPYGGLIGPAADLLRLGRAMLGDGRLEGRTLLEPATVALAWTPTVDRAGRPLPVGLGWRQGTNAGEPFWFHLGGGGGFRSEIRVYPRLDMVVVVSGNETSFETDPLARLIVDLD